MINLLKEAKFKWLYWLCIKSYHIFSQSKAFGARSLSGRQRGQKPEVLILKATFYQTINHQRQVNVVKVIIKTEENKETKKEQDKTIF